MATRNQIITIHVCKKEAGFTSDKAYRDFLFKIAGVTSSKDLSEDDANRVIKAMGAKTKPRQSVKKPIIQIPSMIEPRKWKFFTPTESQWKNMGKFIDAAEKKGMAAVFIINSDGTRQVKIRDL